MSVEHSTKKIAVNILMLIGYPLSKFHVDKQNFGTLCMGLIRQSLIESCTVI